MSQTQPQTSSLPASEPIIGIDLGTTNSLVAYCDERGPRILTSPDGRKHLPSVVHIDPTTGRRTVGQEALAHAVERPTETIYSAKRLMGRGMADLAGELPFLPYSVVAHSSGQMVEIDVGGQRFTPQQIGAAVLGELKRWAEVHFGREVKKAVVTVPAYFDDAQRQATRDAGAIAGLEVVRVVNEPTAAALAYGLDKSQTGTIAVYDLGGGTFDISILKLDNGLFRVLSTNGDTHLGGDDFDRALIGLFQSEMGTQLGREITFPPSTKQAIRTLAESLKTRLSTEASASVEIDLGSTTYRRTVTRDEFLALIKPLVARSLERCALALKDAGSPAIDRVVMVGGSTYIPYVREEVGRFFGTEPYTALNPMEVVALGASVQGAILARINRDLLLQDIIPLSLGIETMGGAVSKLITKGRAIPCAADEMFSTYVEGQTNVKIHVLQGERELVADCRSLAEFNLTGIPPMPAGLPKIKVRFLVDASGILTVSATEERSGTKAAIQIVPTYGLTREEVSQMTKDAVTHARADMAAHRLIDLRNQVTVDTNAIEKALRIVGDDIDAGYLRSLKDKTVTVQALAAEGKSLDALQLALHELGHLSAPLAEMAVTKTLKKNT